MAKYDVVIIGSGPGGYVAAIRASQWGLTDAVVEKDPFLGGTCLHVGCIPTKVFLHHADLYDYFKRAEEFGFEVKDVKINWPAMLTRKDKIVKKHAGGIAALFKKNKVDSITGWGRDCRPWQSLSGERRKNHGTRNRQLHDGRYRFRSAFFARCRNRRRCHSDQSRNPTLQPIPKSLIVVGCGAVGVEFASIFRTFGSEVTLLEAVTRVVPLEDEEISAELHKALVKRGMKIELEAKVESVKKDANGASATYESLGAGDLTARVAVEGRDEVARLAESFNRAAGQIEQLVQGHKTLLANASHELRTPLARIHLAVELMKASADAKLKSGLEQDIAELDWLVDEILLASRLDAVTEALATEELDVLALAAEECARYDDAQLEGKVVNIRGDARLLRRLLRNLLENARRHGAPPTQVRVAQDAGNATITVWDNGPGVPQAEFENIFRPFYRPGDARDRAGTGLGLALVRQIAHRHGGDARCTLMADGRSCFVVTLPA